MEEFITLNDISPGESAIVLKSELEGNIQRRLLDLGLIENTLVECVGKSPSGDPKAYLIRGAVIAIRSEDSKKIIVTTFSKEG